MVTALGGTPFMYNHSFFAEQIQQDSQAIQFINIVEYFLISHTSNSYEPGLLPLALKFASSYR